MHEGVKWYLPNLSVLATFPGHASTIMGTINIRDVPKDFPHLVKRVATVEHACSWRLQRST